MENNELYVILIFFLLQCILYVFLIGTILRRRSLRDQAIIPLILYVVASLVWALAQLLVYLDEQTLLPNDLLERIQIYGLLVLSVLFLGLTRSFLQFKGVGWGWWAVGVAWTAAAVALDENLLTVPETLPIGNQWSISRQEFGLYASILGWGFFVAAAALLTLITYRRTQQPLHKNRITYWFLTLVLTIAGGVLFFAGHKASSSGIYLSGVCCAVYVILIHHLPDVRQMARRAISYLIITLLAVLIYTAGFLVAQQFFQFVPPLLAGAIMALVLAILFDPLLRWIQRLVNQMISGTTYDPSRTLREYSTSISNILDLDRLATVAVGLISEAMEIRHGALFVVHYEAGNQEAGGNNAFRLRGTTGMGEDHPPGLLSDESPVALYLREERRPLPQYDIDLLPRFRKTSTRERDWLSNMNADVYVPIYAKGEWIGLLTLGPKASGDRYFDDDLSLLSMLADQTAVALQNARLFDDLKMRNAENEQLNRELTGANRELTRLGQIKTDFIHIASHELRTPLTKILGYNDVLGEMIKTGSLTRDDGEQMTLGIRAAIQRLETIVKAMFDVSKIETETLTLNLLPSSLAFIVLEAKEKWTDALQERKQTLTLEGLAGLPTIIADRTRLTQAFSHLIQNAIKFTPDGGQIEIRGWLRDEDLPPEEQTFEIVVADNGIGIARDDLERIFDKFYRTSDVMLHSTGETKFQGAGPGLGLTIARGIVEAHGGFMWAESPGYDERTCPGTEFHIVLPVQPGHVESAGLQAVIADLYSNGDRSM